jgi:hypothetical protein
MSEVPLFDAGSGGKCMARHVTLCETARAQFSRKHGCRGNCSLVSHSIILFCTTGLYATADFLTRKN